MTMPTVVQPPSGLAAITEFCGDLQSYVRADGTVSPAWETEKIASCRLPAPMVLSWDPATEIRRIRVHKKAVPAFEAAFEAVHGAGLWRHLRVFGGAYNFRVVRGGAKLSTHAYGLATDHDPQRNPLGRAPAACAMPSDVVAIMEDHGFTWGGRFKTRKDCMHFQLARNY
jgi:hypothetical protein